MPVTSLRRQEEQNSRSPLISKVATREGHRRPCIKRAKTAPKRDTVLESRVHKASWEGSPDYPAVLTLSKDLWTRAAHTGTWGTWRISLSLHDKCCLRRSQDSLLCKCWILTLRPTSELYFLQRSHFINQESLERRPCWEGLDPAGCLQACKFPALPTHTGCLGHRSLFLLSGSVV